MNILDTVRDKIHRHRERHTALGYHCVFADSIAHVNTRDWDQLASQHSVFISRDYLQVIENHSPANTCQRYAMAYYQGQPAVIVACQVADIAAQDMIEPGSKVRKALLKPYEERVLVCGNLVSSGLHGVAFAPQLDKGLGWRILSEILYRMRRADRLNGRVDFALIKDVKDTDMEEAAVLERYSYRKIKTDPDMVLNLAEGVASFDDYMASLNSKYRNRAKKVIKTLDKAGFSWQEQVIDQEIDGVIHGLYQAVESRSDARPACLPEGYFLGLQQALGERFKCMVLRYEGVIVGFITVINDRGSAVAYYVGMDYQLNQQYPLYFRLLQLVIQAAVDMGCNKVLFGRTALEPKANLGAQPVDTYVWARHRVPMVNYVVRKLFSMIPYDEAPERVALKAPAKQ